MTGPTTESGSSIALSLATAKQRRNISCTTSKESVSKCMFCVGSKIIYENLYKNYEATTQNIYNVNVVNDIIIECDGRITTAFKDSQIYDNACEYLKDFYHVKKAEVRFLELAKKEKAKQLPNYFCIEERKYMLKNVKKKEKLVATKDQKVNKINQVMTKGFMNELVKRASIIPPQTLVKMDLISVLDKFIDRDSLSLIENSNCTSINLTIGASEAGNKGSKEEVKVKAIKIGKNAVKSKKAIQVKGKVRHMSQELIKDSLQPKANTVSSNGRMSAIGYYRPREDCKSSLIKKKDSKLQISKNLVKSSKNLRSDTSTHSKLKPISKERKNAKLTTRTNSYYAKSSKPKAIRNIKPVQTLQSTCNIILKKTPTVIFMSNKDLAAKPIIHKSTGSSVKMSAVKSSSKKKAVIVVKKVRTGFGLGASTTKAVIAKQTLNV
eukprot:TRINITY_DN13832_c0_g3_i1.p1 TRINITY_DN13832_c0_g3~~TRINITY_DN13832_c0_g3_i1.p1  ORF type:complete len:437 (-),score=97.00 TRINITY_DN13832_c0_g3_i1:29-1339(-)